MDLGQIDLDFDGSKTRYDGMRPFGTDASAEDCTVETLRSALRITDRLFLCHMPAAFGSHSS
jgi:hypothetical protein